MVSAFLCACHGLLRIPDSNEDATVTIEPGGDDWWNGENVLLQVKALAIPIFEKLHPGKVALFQFDCSSSHEACAADALRVSSMNLNPGGKQAKLRDTFFSPNNIPQSMTFPDDFPGLMRKKIKGVETTIPMAGLAKGIKQVLMERGLWQPGLKHICKLCDSKNKDSELRYDMTRVTCCAQRILETQQDFRDHLSSVEEAIKSAGHLSIFLPKFHPELNFIEMFWGAAKRFARDHCDYSIVALRETVPKALNSVTLAVIRRFARKTQQYMDLYRRGADGPFAEFVARRYKSHRPISREQYSELLQNYKTRYDIRD